MQIKTGNIFESKMQTKVNTVNCVGVMGKGIAAIYKKKYPEMFNEYKKLCKSGEIQIGKPYVYKDIIGNTIINFPTKKHWKNDSKPEYIEKGLKWFVDNYEKYDIESVAFPALGCGNGNLKWEEIEPIMIQYLKDLPIEIEIYKPSESENNFLTVVEVIKQLQDRLYIDKNVFQKICYILKLNNIDIGLEFTKEKSKGINNLIQYLTRNKYIDVNNKITIKKYKTPNFTEKERNAIDKTVDMFCRFQNIEEIEKTSSIIYAYEDLKKRGEVTEQEIYEYILDWKPNLINNIKLNIKDCAVMGWIKSSKEKDTVINGEEYDLIYGY